MGNSSRFYREILFASPKLSSSRASQTCVGFRLEGMGPVFGFRI